MALPVTLTVGPLAAADADNVSLAQTAAGAEALAIDGAAATAGVATFDVARRVLITSVGNDSGITFRVTGTNSDGNPIRQTVTGANASTASTTEDFLTVTEVFTSGATAADVTIGTSGVASSPWKLVNAQHQAPVSIAFGCIVDGTIDYTLEYAYTSPNDNANQMGSALGNYPTPPTPWSLTALANKVANTDATVSTPFQAWRMKINSGTGSVTVTAIEAGMAQAAA